MGKMFSVEWEILRGRCSHFKMIDALWSRMVWRLHSDGY